jgi:hypothetical protein
MDVKCDAGRLRNETHVNLYTNGFNDGARAVGEPLAAALKAIEPTLIELSKTLLKANCKGNGVAEHDAILISIGFLEAKIRSLLSKGIE